MKMHKLIFRKKKLLNSSIPAWFTPVVKMKIYSTPMLKKAKTKLAATPARETISSSRRAFLK